MLISDWSRLDSDTSEVFREEKKMMNGHSLLNNGELEKLVMSGYQIIDDTKIVDPQTNKYIQLKETPIYSID